MPGKIMIALKLIKDLPQDSVYTGKIGQYAPCYGTEFSDLSADTLLLNSCEDAEKFICEKHISNLECIKFVSIKCEMQVLF